MCHRWFISVDPRTLLSCPSCGLVFHATAFDLVSGKTLVGLLTIDEARIQVCVADAATRTLGRVWGHRARS